MRQLKLQVNGFNQADENTPYQAFVRRPLIESSCDFAFAHGHKENYEIQLQTMSHNFEYRREIRELRNTNTMVESNALYLYLSCHGGCLMLTGISLQIFLRQTFFISVTISILAQGLVTKVSNFQSEDAIDNQPFHSSCGSSIMQNGCFLLFGRTQEENTNLFFVSYK